MKWMHFTLEQVFIAKQNTEILRQTPQEVEHRKERPVPADRQQPSQVDVLRLQVYGLQCQKVWKLAT